MSSTIKDTGPITPDEAIAARREVFPPEVFAAFNELIVENMVAGRATIRQNAVVDRILLRCREARRDTVFDRNWLDIEDAYRAVGWTVSYTKPAYEAYFEFKRREP